MLFTYSIIAGLLAWIISSACPMWLRWSLYFGAPLVAGLIYGVLFGQLEYGLEVGATVMMAYMGLVAIGGSIPSEMALAGYLGVAMTMLSNSPASVGLTIAVPLGLLGVLCQNAKMALNPIWVHKADQYAAQGNTRGVVLMNLVGSQVIPFITYFIPTFLCVYFGAPFLEQILAMVPVQVIEILKLIGNMVPALGLAMLMTFLFRKTTVPFFIIGFVLASYLGMDIMSLAMLGIAAGILHLFYMRGKGVENV